MIRTFTLGEKFKQLWLILIPILITQLAMYSMTFFDIVMTGKYSPEHLAGVAVGSSLWNPVFTGLSGILLSVTPIVAQLTGAGKGKEVPFTVTQGVYAGTAMALVVLGIGAAVLSPVLDAMHLEAEVRSVAFHYLASLSFGIVPLFIYNALRAFIDALGKTRVTMLITLMSLPINVVLNYLLIYGKLGLPEMGGVGAGIASAITYWLITAIACVIIHREKPFRDYRIFSSFGRISIPKWKEIFVLGVPIGMSIFFETSIFSAVTLFMSKFGTTVIAAHQSALNFASALYMVPLSMSMALTIVIGFEAGARRPEDARQYSMLGIASTIATAALLGSLLFIFRESVAHLYSSDSDVAAMTARFLLFAVFFQLSDAILAPIQGTLRGYKDVNVTFIMALVSFWIIGLPLGYFFSTTDLGPFGFWIGLIVGLAVGAVALSFRLRFVQKKQKSQAG